MTAGPPAGAALSISPRPSPAVSACAAPPASASKSSAQEKPASRSNRMTDFGRSAVGGRLARLNTEARRHGERHSSRGAFFFPPCLRASVFYSLPSARRDKERGDGDNRGRVEPAAEGVDGAGAEQRAPARAAGDGT